MRNQERSLGYFFLLLLALAAGAVRLDADVPERAGGAGHERAGFARPALGCSAADAASEASYCASATTVAWAES